MGDRYFYNADGEMLIVPEMGRLGFLTELGAIQVGPGEIVVIPRGEIPGRTGRSHESRGYICENYGQHFRLPDLGPIGANGLANPRDFETPVAWYEDREGDDGARRKIWRQSVGVRDRPLAARCRRLARQLRAVPLRPAPVQYDRLDLVRSSRPEHLYRADLAVERDRARQIVDFVIFPDRWLVAENTFRPPWYHRNVMSEYMGLVYGQYDAKEEGFVPGGGSLHNQMSAHGPDLDAFEKASNADLKPQKLEGTLAFMFESRYIIRPTKFAMETSELQHEYFEVWQRLKKNFKG